MQLNFGGRFSKPPNGTMENRRTSTMASRRIPSMERGRIHLFSMEDGRIPSFNAFLTKNAISVHYTYGIQISTLHRWAACACGPTGYFQQATGWVKMEKLEQISLKIGANKGKFEGYKCKSFEILVNLSSKRPELN